MNSALQPCALSSRLMEVRGLATRTRSVKASRADFSMPGIARAVRRPTSRLTRRPPGGHCSNWLLCLSERMHRERALISPRRSTVPGRTSVSGSSKQTACALRGWPSAAVLIRECVPTERSQRVRTLCNLAMNGGTDYVRRTCPGFRRRLMAKRVHYYDTVRLFFPCGTLADLSYGEWIRGRECRRRRA